MENNTIDEKINIAVIGVGNMGKHHARVYSELPEANLIAVCDSDEKRVKEIAERFGCRYYTDHLAMFQKERNNIDAVSIAIPTKMHSMMATTTMQQGLHVLIEKPIADNIENARLIIQAAKDTKVKLMIGHIERFNPAVQRLKEMIDRGELGEINTIVARRVGAFPPQIRDANVVVDLAIHDIDIFNFLLGRLPIKINMNSGKALIDHRDDFADILLDYGGTNAFVQANWITPVKIRNLTVTGTKGYAELNYITQELVLYKSRLRNIDTFNDVVEFGTPEKSVIEIEKVEPLKLELRSFLGCIKNDEQPPVTGEDALLALQIALNVADDTTNGDDVNE